MSYLRDALHIIDDDTPVFAFLPVVNVTYLLILEYQFELFLEGVVVTFLSSFLYLLIDQNPTYDDYISWVRVVFLVWLTLYGESIRRLVKEFEHGLVFPEILVFISITFVSLVAWDKLFSKVIEDYSGEI